MRLLCPRLLGFVLLLSNLGVGGEDAMPAAERAQMQQVLDERLSLLNGKIAATPSPELFSQRGDILFFLGRFPEAVEDYTAFAKDKPELAATNWRRGLALYYAGREAEAASQFESCHTRDDTDRENGIWRYLSQCRTLGRDSARKDMLVYTKGDRKPFTNLYDMFAGKQSADDVLKAIMADGASPDEREGQLFYGNLYFGLNELAEGRPETARPFLVKAVRNEWPLQAAYGPRYMWHVARLQLELLDKAPPKSNQ
ncbi:tetratricopeptide repeat protein [Planctomicrobium piriforme]|uniref:Tetratricopeptide repeat-containing protein n=1 Tax=Planctomicrobium piriforme TaxID=1576369 RepID=A0A1I3TCT4_9PLAN|nr:tetratricopeptide repeat protein [Planctomicrobium piriforme]SFJ68199.1 Tetratricopeptide repeat-containing protein [Planctomicrobium piriforme]